LLPCAITQKEGVDTPCTASVGGGCASEVQAFQRLDGSVSADGPRDALGQLVAAGLSPGLLAPRGRAVHQIHSILLIRSNIT